MVKVHPCYSILMLIFFFASRSVPEMPKSFLVCKIFPPCSAYIWTMVCSESTTAEINTQLTWTASETLWRVSWVPLMHLMWQKIPVSVLPKADSHRHSVPSVGLSQNGHGLNPTREVVLGICTTWKIFLFRETCLASSMDVKISNCWKTRALH